MQDRQAKFLSTLSLRRATSDCGQYCIRAQISIHALLAESDTPARMSSRLLEISIHALLAESDDYNKSMLLHLKYFYPRSPCGERLSALAPEENPTQFLSTLSLRRATYYFTLPGTSSVFLSTLSLRRATPPAPPKREFYKISIHALLAESDVLAFTNHAA